MVVDFDGSIINPINFYLLVVGTLVKESTRDFFSSVRGAFEVTEGNLVLEITPTSTYPALQHSHVVWALQRLTETLTSTRIWNEFEGSIALRSTQLGTVKLQRAGLGIGIGLNTTTALNDSMLNWREDLTHPRDFLIHLRPIPNGGRINGARAFLTTIRNLAELASHDQWAELPNFEYRDQALGIWSLVYVFNREITPLNYHTAVTALAYMVVDMYHRRPPFPELEAVFTRENLPGRTLGGSQMKLLAPRVAAKYTAIA